MMMKIKVLMKYYNKIKMLIIMKYYNKMIKIKMMKKRMMMKMNG